MKTITAIKNFFKRPSRKDLIFAIDFLWQIIDDIDTADDMARDNDKAYRNIVSKRQRKRWEIGITTDGYTLDITGIKRPGEEQK